MTAFNYEIDDEDGYADTEYSRELAAPGPYTVIIKKATQNDAADKSWLSLMLVVKDQPKIAAIFHSLYLHYPSRPAAERYARNFLRKYLIALGLSAITDTDQLLNIPIEVDLGVSESNGSYPAKNDVIAVRPLRGKQAKVSPVTEKPAARISVRSAEVAAGKYSALPTAAKQDFDDDIPF